MQSIPFIAWCLKHLNYWTITLLMAIESSFIPFPSELVVPPAAYKSAMDGSMNPWLIILFATIGAVLSSTVWPKPVLATCACLIARRYVRLKSISTVMALWAHWWVDWYLLCASS